MAVTATVGAAGATLEGAVHQGLRPRLVVPAGTLARPAQVTVRLLLSNPLTPGPAQRFLGGWLVTVTAPDGRPYTAAADRAALQPAMTLEVLGDAIGRRGQQVRVLDSTGRSRAAGAVSARVLRVPVSDTTTAVVLTGPVAVAGGTPPRPARPAIARPAPARPTALPTTGSTSTETVLTGAGAVLLGAGLLVAARRRRPDLE